MTLKTGVRETVRECCGDECRFKDYPIARVMLCGLEITEKDREAAKEAYCKHRIPQP